MKGLLRCPSFFIHYRRVSLTTLKEFLKAWFRDYNVQGAIDDLTDDLPEEYYIPLGTAYRWLTLVREKLREDFQALGLDPNRLRCLNDLRAIPESSAMAIFDSPGPWLPRSPRDLIPP